IGDETFDIEPELRVTATADDMSACDTDTNITITAYDGDGNYVYAVVGNNVTPVTFTTTNPVTVTAPGDYDVYVRDNGGTAPFCEDKFDLNISQDPPLTVSANNDPIDCFGDMTTLTIIAGGGSGIYEYSIDDGTTFQDSNIFNNIISNDYDIVVRDSESCTVDILYSVSSTTD